MHYSVTRYCNATLAYKVYIFSLGSLPLTLCLVYAYLIHFIGSRTWKKHILHPTTLRDEVEVNIYAWTNFHFGQNININITSEQLKYILFLKYNERSEESEIFRNVFYTSMEIFRNMSVEKVNVMYCWKIFVKYRIVMNSIVVLSKNIGRLINL